MSMIPCLTWVRRGKAKAKPDVVQLDKDVLKKLIEETEERLEEQEEGEESDANEDEEPVEGATAADSQPQKRKPKKRKQYESVEDEYKMDDYDEEEDEFNPLQGIGNLTIYADNEEDPYVTLKDEADSDEENFEIKPTDNLVVCGKVDNDMCCLEVHVYNSEIGNFYCHHELMLSTFPLVVEWMDFDVGEDKPGNFLAVGSMEPTIDIWDLDLVENLEPVVTLGTKKKKKSKKKAGGHGHTDAVLDLSWNSNVRSALASASADFTVGLWDMSEGKMVTAITQHKEKVQCVQWHPVEGQSLLSGSFDHTVKVYDCRSPDTSFKSWDLEGEVEAVLWDRYCPLNFYASTDKGQVFYIDTRQDKPIFTLAAHSDAVAGLSQSCGVQNMLVTASADKKLKVWDVSGNKPSLVLARDLLLGQLHCLGNCPNAEFTFAMGGDREMKVWDIRESADVRKHFLASPADSQAMSGATMDEEMDVNGTSQPTTQKTKQKKKKKKNKKK